MATPRVERRRQNIIGSNLRHGVMPGGFTSSFATGKRGTRKRAVAATQEEVNEAARACLAKRGFHNRPSGFERAAMNYPRPSIA